MLRLAGLLQDTISLLIIGALLAAKGVHRNGIFLSGYFDLGFELQEVRSQ
jgi:hypothetical protein